MSLPLAADTAVVDVSDPSFTRVELALLADHGASIERGPFVGPPASHTADLRVEIVNLDATYSHVDWVTGSSRRSFLRPLSEPGEHGFTIQNDSPQAATIGVNTALRYWYKGRPAAIGICEPEDEKLIALPKDLTTGWSGRLIEAFVCGAMQVYPAGGKGRSPVQENRNLDYTEDAYDDSAWVPVNVLGGVGVARVLYYEISPFIRLFASSPDDLARDFPDPYAALVAPPGATLLRARPLPLDSGMDFYIRWRVTIPDTGSYDGYILGDDSLELAIDGVPQARAGTGSMVQASFSVDLTAGEHLFTMHVNNKRNAEIAWSLNPGGQFNPSFGTWSLFRSGFRNAEGFVAHADGTGKVLVSDRVPGMTYGRAIRLLVDEAVARGCVAPALGFTDGADSDGVPWEYGVVSTRIMNDVHSVLKEQSVANIDFSIRTGAFVLDMWNFAGKGIDAPVPFRAKTDMTPATMTTLTRKGGGPVTNAFLARTAYGWDEVVRDSSIADFGRQEAGYSLGAANSPADVSTTANGRLDIVSVPRYQYEAVHNTTNDDEWAFNGYDLGDRVPLTPPGESTTLERVVSIAVAEGDDTGRAIETVSLRDIVYYASPIEHFVGLLGQWAKKMIPGTGRGSWPETQPVTSPTVPAPVVKWDPPVQVPSGGWALLATYPHPPAVAPVALAAVGGLVYAASEFGPGFGDPPEFFNAYSPGTDTWGADLDQPLDNRPVLVVNGSDLIGVADGNADPGTSLYSVSGNAWSALTAAPEVRDGGVVAKVGGTIYVIGGFLAPGFLSDPNIDAYSISGDSWSTGRAPFPDGGVVGAAVAVHGTDIYLFGGDYNDGITNTQLGAYKYDTVGDAWTTLGAVPWALGGLLTFDGGCAATLGTLILVGGGGGVGSGVPFWLYDTVTDTYTPVDDCPIPFASTATSIGTTAFVAGTGCARFTLD